MADNYSGLDIQIYPDVIVADPSTYPKPLPPPEASLWERLQHSTDGLGYVISGKWLYDAGDSLGTSVETGWENVKETGKEVVKAIFPPWMLFFLVALVILAAYIFGRKVLKTVF